VVDICSDRDRYEIQALPLADRRGANGKSSRIRGSENGVRGRDRSCNQKSDVIRLKFHTATRVLCLTLMSSFYLLSMVYFSCFLAAYAVLNRWNLYVYDNLGNSGYCAGWTESSSWPSSGTNPAAGPLKSLPYTLRFMGSGPLHA
jgi:hypothetical protein